jgi:DNA polymerase elongation subunit (family B)
MDCECYVDYFLVAFRNVERQTVMFFEQFDGQPLDVSKLVKVLQAFRLVTFNGNHYDWPVLSYAMTGATCAEIRACSDAIIVGNKYPWEVARQFSFSIYEPDHIDLFEVAPGMGALKLYGGRLHCRTLADLPFPVDSTITPEQRPVVREYCGNDLALTIALYRDLLPQLELRAAMTEEYGIDMRSKSDAQIAEAVIKRGVQELSGKAVNRPIVPPKTKYQYQTPSFIQFQTRPLAELLAVVQDAEFRVNDANGAIIMPDALADATIRIGRSVYRLGIGGLHSTEACAAHVSDADYVLFDYDVASYYPSIILRCGFSPKHLGAHFLTVYRGLVEQRLAAKHAGNKGVADSFKIVVNGSFGKLGSKWSVLYSPDLMIQVTITGQLALLMLIELMEQAGIAVVSANTDGIVMKCPVALVDDMAVVIEYWEGVTGFVMEGTPYQALYSRDVNSYIALKVDGKAKQKGALAYVGTKGMALEKNPSNYVCIDAVIAKLRDGVPMADTIHACRDITRFVSLRTVNGGAVKGDAYLGRVVRWYYAAGETGTINYKTNGNIVAKSLGGKPLMTLPDAFPTDIDYGWYVREANGLLADIGARV